MESANIPVQVNNCEETVQSAGEIDNSECERNNLKRKGDNEDNG